MNKQPYEHIFNLLDFADELAGRIKPGNPDNGNYFMTLVYVEDILDKFGRGFVLTTVQESGRSNDEADNLMHQATTRMDSLRQTIRQFAQLYDFDEVLDNKAKQLKREWHKQK